MDRRAAGAAVLLVALLSTFVFPALSGGTVVSGTAFAVALPGPPPIGTCVVLAESTVTAVECARPHDAEVFAGWAPDDPAQPTRTANACDAGLAAVTRVPLPGAPAGWVPTVFSASAELIRAPSSERVGARGWWACLMRPTSRARYVGSGLDRSSALGAIGRPAAFGRCLYFDLVTIVDCGTAHSAEVLASSWRSAAVPTGTATDPGGVPTALTREFNVDCVALAQRLTDNPDPTYGGRLTVLVTTHTISGWGTTEGSVAQFSSQCVLAANSGQLADSVVGLGTAPLPTI